VIVLVALTTLVAAERFVESFFDMEELTAIGAPYPFWARHENRSLSGRGFTVRRSRRDTSKIQEA
jgi:hypothetical protein